MACKAPFIPSPSLLSLLSDCDDESNAPHNPSYRINHFNRLILQFQFVFNCSQCHQCHRSCHVVICRNRCMISFVSTQCHVIYPNPSSLQFLCETFDPNPISSCNCDRVLIYGDRAIYDVYCDAHNWRIPMIRKSLMKMMSLYRTKKIQTTKKTMTTCAWLQLSHLKANNIGKKLHSVSI